MGRKIKKNTQGYNSKFISRAKAIKKLGLSIKNFRKLCILKGVHPRMPTKAIKKQHQVYYHTKDIIFLSQDSMMDYFKQLEIYKRKLQKAISRKNDVMVRRLKENKPQINLNHVVRERYENFQDAIKDLDDCLSTLALFQALPTHRLFKIDPLRLKISSALMNFLKLYVIQQKSL